MVLEVGTGVGGVADDVSRSGEAELVGMDLVTPSTSRTDTSGATQAAFGPSFGVHSTLRRRHLRHGLQLRGHPPYGLTRVAFDRLCRLPKIDGRLNIWVYRHPDEERTFVRRRLMDMERAIQPWAWPLPDKWQSMALTPLIPMSMGDQVVRLARKHGGPIRYGWREAMHPARDRFTPRYIHRHSNEEVSACLNQAGDENLPVVGHRSRPTDVPVAFTANTGSDGIRRV